MQGGGGRGKLGVGKGDMALRLQRTCVSQKYCPFSANTVGPGSLWGRMLRTLALVLLMAHAQQCLTNRHSDQ